MSRFHVKEGLFYIDEQPQFVHAGEFHYFRTPPDQWRHRLNLLLQAGFNTVAVYIPWLWHQPAPDVSDVDGSTHPMRDLAGFLDLAAEMGLYIIPRPGPYIMAETINEGIPPWVFEQFPQASYIDHEGRTQNIASYLQPDFLACVDRWYRAVFEVLAPRQISHGGRIIMTQLDNEMGMIQWVRNIVDVNPDTLARFAAYLQTAYGSYLAQRYPASDLPAFLHEQLTQPQAAHSASVLEDYRRFYRIYLREYMLWLWERARAYGMDTPPVVNIHGFGNGGKTFPIGISQLIDTMEIPGMVSATDVYPIFIGEGNFHQLVLVNEMTKALHNPDQALFSIEFQAGGNQDFGGAQSSLYDLHSRLCISCGMRAINHYLFYDGENDPVLSPTRRHDWGHPVRKDGTLRRHYARYPKLSRVITAYGEDLIRAQPKTVTTIGFQIDSYMTEVNNARTRPATDILTHQRDVILFDFIARGLALTHRPFNAVELARASLDVVQIPVLWVMMEKQCDEATQRKLVDYVQQGGRLVLVGRMCEETFQHQPCTVLKDAIGISGLKADAPFTQASLQVFSYPHIPASFIETYSGDFEEVFATNSSGGIIGFTKHVGAGQVMVFGAAIAANTLEDLDILNQMASRMGCDPLFTLTDWADVRLSEGANGRFLFVSNYQDDPLAAEIFEGETALLCGNRLHLPARRGVMIPLEWQVRPGIVIHYLTSEVIGITETSGGLIIRTEPPNCTAEVSISGYRCESSIIVQRISDQRSRLQVKNGVIEFFPDTAH